MNRIFFVRHGEPNRDNEGLTDLGREQSAAAARKIASYDLGARTVWLTSIATRAEQTMQSMQAVLGFDHYVASSLIEQGGNFPAGIRNLDSFLSDVVQVHKMEPELVDDLVVVTHAPLMAMVKGKGVDFAEIVEYTPHSWNNDLISQAREAALEDAILLARTQTKV